MNIPISRIKIGERFRRELGDIDELASSIRELGLLHPVCVDGRLYLIAGARRIEAVKRLGWNVIPANIVPLKDLARGQIHENTIRKDFTASELAEIAERVATTRVGHRPSDREKVSDSDTFPHGPTLEVVAEYAGVSRDYVWKALKVARAAREEPERFGKTLRSVDSGQLSIDYACNMVKRFNLRRELGTPNMPRGKYDVIYSDPPWEKAAGSVRGDPEHHYPTMSLEQLLALEVPSAEDAVLLLWCVPAHTHDAFHIMKECGFDYVSQLVWVKTTKDGSSGHFGTGYWFRVQHELLLVGRKGDFPTPLEHDRPPSVLQAPMRGHSEKPTEVYSIIEAMFPNNRYLELFARKTRPGWTVWGNQLGIESEAFPHRTYASVINDSRDLARPVPASAKFRDVASRQAEGYFSLSHFWMASAIASPRPPFLPPYFSATLTRNSFSTLSGMTIVILPMLRLRYAHVSVCLNMSCASKTYEHTRIQRGSG